MTNNPQILPSPAHGRAVVVVAFPRVQSLDVTGPVEVFSVANRFLQRRSQYQVRLAATQSGPVITSSGLQLMTDWSLASLQPPLNTLLIAGGDGVAAAARDQRMLEQVRRLAVRSRRVVSVCSGAFILAEAGLLAGRQATTHWDACDLLARAYPDIDVQPDPIFVRDGKYWTSAGVTAGIDLALALVEADHGREVALAAARRLVVFLRRPGNQTQFSAQLSAQFARTDPIRDVQRAVLEDPAATHTVASMAARAAMSERHFARVFAVEVGVTPARFVERVRLEAARRWLEESTDPVDHVARRVGLGSTETLRKLMIRCLGVSPAEYRRRFKVPLR